MEVFVVLNYTLSFALVYQPQGLCLCKIIASLEYNYIIFLESILHDVLEPIMLSRGYVYVYMSTAHLGSIRLHLIWLYVS